MLRLRAMANIKKSPSPDPGPSEHTGESERLDALHVVAIELKIERADILLQPLEPNGFRDDQ